MSPQAFEADRRRRRPNRRRRPARCRCRLCFRLLSTSTVCAYSCGFLLCLLCAIVLTVQVHQLLPFLRTR